jgi:hypothetical protein
VTDHDDEIWADDELPRQDELAPEESEAPPEDVLDPANNAGYGTWRLPAVRDTEIADRVRELLASRPVPSLDPGRVAVLSAFAERMATLARRTGSVDRLRAGLDAMVLAHLGAADRDAVVPLALLWRSAEVLGIDPREVFLAAETRAGTDGGALARFADRRPEDRGIDAMGYLEVEDEFGFHYERTW